MRILAAGVWVMDVVVEEEPVKRGGQEVVGWRVMVGALGFAFSCCCAGALDGNEVDII